MAADTKLKRRDILRLIGYTSVAGASAALGGCCGMPVRHAEDRTRRIADLVVSNQATVGVGLHPIFLEHTLVGHPENHLRIQSILNRLVEDQNTARLAPLRLLPTRTANFEELRLAHDQSYIDEVQSLVAPGSFFTQSKWSPYGGPAVFAAAGAAAASAVDIVWAVERGDIKSGFALVRPPGHHARRRGAAGYCVFNNTVIAVRSLRTRSISRVAIFDFDVHHGDGIQDAFFGDSQVLYISTHQDGWPGTGGIDKIGVGAGRGFNINIPLPFGTGDNGFEEVFRSVVEPALRRFQPHIVIGAAGFDTHWRDYQGGLGLSSTGQARLVQNLKRVADDICAGRLALILEGGYQLDVVSTGVSNAIRVLAQEPGIQSWIRDDFGKGPDPEPSVQEIVQKVAALHGLKKTRR